MKYTITINKLEPYNVKATIHEGTDGKQYESRYGLPEGVKAVPRDYETGEVKYTQHEVYSQTQEDLDLTAVIKAVNKL